MNTLSAPARHRHRHGMTLSAAGRLQCDRMPRVITLSQPASQVCSPPCCSLLIKAKFHYTDLTGPSRTFSRDRAADPGLRQSPCGSARVSDRVRGLCLVGSSRARVVEFSYYRAADTEADIERCCSPGHWSQKIRPHHTCDAGTSLATSPAKDQI